MRVSRRANGVAPDSGLPCAAPTLRGKFIRARLVPREGSQGENNHIVLLRRYSVADCKCLRCQPTRGVPSPLIVLSQRTQGGLSKGVPPFFVSKCECPLRFRETNEIVVMTDIKCTRVHRNLIERLMMWRSAYKTTITEGFLEICARGPSPEASEQTARRRWALRETQYSESS